ncbi:23686_t:CDS:1, partial [Dentiscutata erythropus]
MPTCSSCNKFFESRQALGNHMKKHLDDSEDDSPSSNQPIYRTSQKLIEITTKFLNEQNMSKRQNIPEQTEISNKRTQFECNLDDSQEMDILNVDEPNIRKDLDVQLYNHKSAYLNYNESTEGQDVEFFEFTEGQDVEFFSSADDSQSSNTSDNEYIMSDLSDTTDIDANEYIEYDHLFSGKSKDSEDIYQEFPSEEYAEFMNIVTRFRVQDSLANIFIRFFNKYSNRNDYPLPTTSQVGKTFIENLKLPGFGWRKEVIYKYEG